MSQKINVNAKASNDVALHVNDYHQRTKHSLEKYAAGPETLDWSLQPDAFRTYAGARQIPLPLNANTITTAYADLYTRQKVPAQTLNLENIASLFEISLGLSAWKQYGPDKWALRCNPSSGNLHPTEGYLVHWDNSFLASELETGVYHYRSDEHSLEQRCLISNEISTTLTSQAGTQQGFVIGLSSIHWREAWKYGERAYRYCQLDVGHAIAAISYAAATLGWSVMQLDNASDQEIDTLLGLKDEASFSQAEKEHPDVLLYISNAAVEDESVMLSLLKQLCDFPGDVQWQGEANRLDRHPMYKWPIIGQVAAATHKPQTTKLKNPYTLDADIITQDQNKTEIQASQLIKQRRSAQAFDPKHELPLETFYAMLDKILPRNITPWNSIHLTPHIHPVFYVHRVSGLTPGLYAMPRYAAAKEMLQAQMRSEFTWQSVKDCPQHIPLYELVNANSMNAARKLSCHQPIASDSAFCVSMLAEFNAVLQQGEWNYRYLHWEAGMLGHVLYLEAEAENFRGTGIGCFFDDAVHQILGIENSELQVVYHFTVGTPIVDNRLITIPPYSHLKR